MVKHRTLAFLLLLVALLLAACGGRDTPREAAGTPGTTDVVAAETPIAQPTPEETVGVAENQFQNPVFRNNFPDPHIILGDDGLYYAYATNGGSRNVQMARSSDLVNWEMLTDAMPGLAPWVRLSNPDVWAPEVMRVGDQYILYYTARDRESGRQCLGVATAARPEGKYQDRSDRPFICQIDEGGTIDAHPFRDEDGTLYLYYKNDGNCCNMPTYIYVQEMTPDGLTVVGEPTRLIRNDRAWEGRVVEAPTMWLHEGQYYLFYSGNNYGGAEYAVGYAICETPLGPCEEGPENPILSSRMDQNPPIVGPGHQTLIEDADGQLWIFYHVWEISGAGIRTDRRFMWMDRLTWEEGRPVVLGPTAAPQPLP